ncbi:MAG: hypothetical protein IJM54_01015 [Thermoguttaceae bacterium]|nr:hypothetical protein [Thermoguttaceae bacterium]
MSWRCPYCSSFNDDDDALQCSTCSTPRPIDTVAKITLRAKLRPIKEAKERVEERIKSACDGVKTSPIPEVVRAKRTSMKKRSDELLSIVVAPAAKIADVLAEPTEKVAALIVPLAWITLALAWLVVVIGAVYIDVSDGWDRFKPRKTAIQRKVQDNIEDLTKGKYADGTKRAFSKSSGLFLSNANATGAKMTSRLRLVQDAFNRAADVAGTKARNDYEKAIVPSVKNVSDSTTTSTERIEEKAGDRLSSLIENEKVAQEHINNRIKQVKQ